MVKKKKAVNRMYAMLEHQRWNMWCLLSFKEHNMGGEH